jgi:hypothetical protein
MIGALFRIERTVADATRRQCESVRDTKSRALVHRFFACCKAERDSVLDESPTADAIRYAHNQRTALGRFLEDGRLPLSNNVSELNLRRQVTGLGLGLTRVRRMEETLLHPSVGAKGVRYFRVEELGRARITLERRDWSLTGPYLESVDLH